VATRKLTVEILGDAKGLGRAFGEAGEHVKGFGSTVAGIGKGMAIGAAAIGGVGLAAVGIGVPLFQAGASMDALDKKAATVFSGSAMETVTAWADDVALKLGMTNSEFIHTAASIGDLLKPMGFTSDEAANMSSELVNLSGALSAWSGGQMSATDVADTITKAMLGETDGLKALGIAISAADVEARIAEKGQKKLTGAAMEQAKAIAVQELVFEKSTDAQTAWKDGSMDAIKIQNKMKASINEAKEAFIRGLYPVLSKVAVFLNDEVRPILAHVTAAFNEGGLGGAISFLGDKFREVWPEIRAALGEMLAGLWSWIQETTPKVLEQLGEWGKQFIAWVGPQIPPMLQELGKLLGDLANWLIDEGLPLLVDKLIEWGNAFVAWVTPLIPPLMLELGKILVKIGEWIITEAVPKLVALALKLGVALASWAGEVGLAIVRGLQPMFPALWDWVTGTAVPWLIQRGAQLAAAFTDWVKSVPGKILELGADILGKIGAFGADLGKALVNGLIGIWNKADLVFPRVEVPGWVPGAGGKGFGGFDIFPDVKPLAEGGIVRSRQGGTFAQIGEAGMDEAVIPLDKLWSQMRAMQGGDIVLNIDGHQFMRWQRQYGRALA